MRRKIEYCTSVDGGCFGGDLVQALSEPGDPAELNSMIPLTEYWAAKRSRNTLRLRFQMFVVYPLLLILQAIFSRRRTYIVLTNPFFAPLLVALAAKLRRHTVVQHVGDLYPEALVYGGNLKSNGWVARVVGRLTSWSFRLCDATVFLGEHLRTYAERTHGRARRSACIALGSQAGLFSQAKPAEPGSGPVTLLYAGHMGRLHDVQTLAEAMGRQPPANWSGRKLRLVFNADGPGVRRLKTCLEQTGVCSSWIEEEFGQTLPDKEWVRQMQSAEVGIVTLVPGAETVAMPCKTYSAMLAGQAVLAICAPESDLANHVVQHDCGWVVAPGDCEGLLRVFGQISSQPGLLLRKRLNAHAAGHQHYSIEAVAAQWHSLLRELAADSLRPSAASA